MIGSVSWLKLMWISSGKSKLKTLGSAAIMSLMSLIFTPINTVTWLNFCKVFCWFCCDDTKNIIFIWFHFLVCMNYLRILFLRKILGVWLIVRLLGVKNLIPVILYGFLNLPSIWLFNFSTLSLLFLLFVFIILFFQN